MRRSFYLLFFLIAWGMSSQAQNDYRSAIGLRLGSPLSASFKTFLGDSGNAIELFGGVRGYSGYSWFNAGGAYQVHKPISDVEGLQWYVGGGASVFFWNYKNSILGNSTTFGILGTLGLDYKFPNAPVNLSADWMPIYFINGFYSGFGGGYGALSVRYTLGG